MCSPSDVPRLLEPIELVPIDTASVRQKYLVRTAGNRQFEISETLFDVISAIDGSCSISQISEKLSEKGRGRFSPDDIARVVKEYLIPHGIIAREGYQPDNKKRASYLYFRIPLLSPKCINPLSSLLGVLFEPAVMTVFMIFTILTLFYFYAFMSHPPLNLSALTFEDMIQIYTMFLVATLAHELGHASACRHYGARSGSIGIGLYLYMPVFYTDVSDTWRLRRSERAAVDVGGVYFQGLVLPVFYLAYLLTRNLNFLNAIYLITLASVTSLNPLFRFDGYWLLSDLSGLPNLRKKSSQILRHYFRKLTGRNAGAERPIVYLRTDTKLFLVVYALLSNIFFLLFAGSLLGKLPELFDHYPDKIVALGPAIEECFIHFAFTNFMGRLSDVFLPTVVLIMISMMAYRFARLPVRKLRAHFKM